MLYMDSNSPRIMESAAKSYAANEFNLFHEYKRSGLMRVL
jgi:hypothetical protein